MAEPPFLACMDITGCRSKRPMRSSVDVLEKKKAGKKSRLVVKSNIL
jgi:hypothetical protein